MGKTEKGKKRVEYVGTPKFFFFFLLYLFFAKNVPSPVIRCTRKWKGKSFSTTSLQFHHSKKVNFLSVLWKFSLPSPILKKDHSPLGL